MECICGCGTRIGRKTDAAHIQAGVVALELLAWDKARSEGRIPPEEAELIDSLVHRGALHYQRLLDAIHGERDSAPLDAGEGWLEESQGLRLDRQHMTERSFFRRSGLRLTEEETRMLDRKHPERSFSGREPARGSRAGAIVDQLERLRGLHAEGVLSDEELAAAKQRLLGGGSGLS